MASYDAFISYSHALDKPVASALQAAVQRLGKPWYRRRALRVFRDDTSLAATPHLWPSIEEALGQSRYLILLASPQSAASPWVGKEVAFWLAEKSIDTFLLAVTDGELNWDNQTGDFTWSAATPLPAALKGRFAVEPKWVDLRPYRHAAPARTQNFVDLAADLAAAIHGVPKEDLLSQELRQQRRALATAWSAAATLLALAGAAGWQWQVAQTQRAKAENALATATDTADRLVFDMAVELRDQPGMPVQTVIRILSGMQAMQDELSKAGNLTPQLQRLQAVALGELSTTLLAQGAWTTARADAERAVAITEDLVKLAPADAGYQRDLAVNLVKLGQARFRLNDASGALDVFNRALAITRKLAAAAPGKSQYQDDLVACLTAIGAVQFVSGKLTEGLETTRQAIAILEKLVAKDPGRKSWQYGLSQAQNRAALILVQLGRDAEALAAYRAALAVRQRLVAAEPANTEYQRGLFDDYTWVGDTLARTGARQDALASYRSGLAIIDKLAASDATNKQWQDELSAGYDNVGEMLALGGANDQALTYFQNSLAIRKRLAAAEPANPVWQRDIEVSDNKIGDALTALGRRQEAAAAYRNALDIALKLAAASPNDWQRQSDLAFCYVKMGDQAAGSDAAAAREYYRKSLAIREKLLGTAPNRIELQRSIALTRERLAALDAAGGAAAAAQADLRAAVDLRQQIAAADPDNALWQAELVGSLVRLAQAGDDPRAHLEQALALMQKLDAAGKLDAEHKRWVGTIKQALAALPAQQ